MASLTLSVSPVYPTPEEGNDLDGAMAGGLAALEQRVVQRLRFWQGTWFMDNTEGTRYDNSVFGVEGSQALAVSALESSILSLEGVSEATVVIDEYDVYHRTAELSLSVTSDDGTISISESVG